MRGLGHADLRVGVDHVQDGSGLDHVAFGGALLDDDTGAWSGQLHRRLVGHHLDHRLVLGHAVADGDQPLRDLGLGQSFAYVRESELVVRHQSRVVAMIACSTRSALGRYCSSSIWTG